jgi:glycosyltransferase involved in cell wall biosynthesis
LISIIVPAHDEAALIQECLRGLTAGAHAGGLEVIVVCNGCSDDTEARARAFGGLVRVLATDVASKTRALNLGDEEARGFPRFYVDADVALDRTAIEQVARALREGPALAAAPTARVDARYASWPVRAYYRVWTALPYFDGAMIGSGVYALSEEGRRRFGRFPDVIADDEFIRRQFLPGERRRVEGCYFTIRPPSRLRGVIREKSRSRLGLYQLGRRHPALAQGAVHLRAAKAGAALLARPDIWPSLPVYLLVAAITRWRARRRALLGDFVGWERDATSRPLGASNSVPIAAMKADFQPESDVGSAQK